ncbi:MAG: carbohydrate-binding protein [Sporocytophaga sp.]|uniref:glycosyl hydrolase family 8 n=1 Tax=Sporocytophaga sp. TaxID=2231183 RepID=UPI001B16F2FF|nr:glycosyl hydrolase family 8 [Sporocytophaga sp.]MBO9699741.1 carbohydrate-binding protein [Sporocytophaga sp.]
MKRKILLFLSLAILGNVWNANGQNMPFPQNKIYPNGIMPTNRNASDASSNYSVWKSNWTAACGDGRYRVKFDTPNQTVSEGIGYGMLMAAYAGDKTYFDGFWNYYKSFRNSNGVMHWKINECSSIVGSNGASDAEFDAAMALIVAHSQWGSAGSINYQNDAKTLISAIKTHELESGTKVVKPGDQFGGSNLTNPSYFTPGYFRVFGKFTNDEAFWNSAADKCYEIINANLSKNNAAGGFVSDWCKADGTYSSNASGYYSGGTKFHYDAVRTPWRIAVDYLWFGTPEAKAYVKKTSDFIRTNGGTKNVKDGYNQNGSAYGTAHNCTFVGTFACAAMGGENQSHLDDSYSDLKGINEANWYFNQTLKTLYLYLLSGNFYNPLSTESANVSPTVSLTAPTSNAAFTVGETITINANASDSDGSVSKVEFYQGTIKLGEDATSPYSFSWTNAAAGSYVITAKATDDKGASTTSASVTITVNAKANVAPTVSLTAPTANTVFTVGETITINANASDSDGSVAKVEFYQGTTKIGEDATSPYSFSWTNAAAGSYVITAKATDDKGASTTSASVTITVNAKANVAPTVSLTAPTANTVFTVGETITISANASDVDGSVSKVEFYQGATKLGEDATSPYSFSWTNAAAGSYVITAKATDDKGASTTSSSVMITVNEKANVSPTISLTTPTANTVFTAGETITISANAADSDGSVAKVEFYQGNTKLGEDVTSPYSFSWTNAAVGSYVITAKATDDKGASTTSSSVAITVNEKTNVSPTVSLTAPTSNQVFTVGEAVIISANASDADGSVAKVEFYLGDLKIGEDVSSPFSISWTDVPVGGYTITAKAFDDKGASTISTAINFTVNAKDNALPTVSIVTPVPNAVFGEGEVINISVNASDPDGSISKVEFYQGTTKIGEVSSSPYSFSWTGIAAGSYSIAAKATDDKGASTTSSIVTIFVQAKENLSPAVSIISPLTNTSFDAGATITFSANASDADGSVAKVEFYQGATKIGEDASSPYSFSWTNVAAGNYSITAKATDDKGAATTSSVINIVVKALDGKAPTVVITSPANNATFVKGKTITINADASDVDGTIAKVEYYEGTVKIGEELLEPYSLLWNNASVGTHTVTVKAIDNSGLSSEAGPITIIVTENTAQKEPYKGSPAIIPGKIEAENFDLGGLDVAYYDDTKDNKGGQYRKDEYVDIESCSEGGYDIGYMDIGEWLDYTVEVKETGTYELGVRVGSPNSGKVLHVEMNGVDISGPVTVANTGDWQKYTTVKVSNIQLTAGIQTMKIVMDSAEFNLNYVEFKKISSPTVSSPYKGTPAIIPGKIEAENFDLGGLDVAYYDDTKDNKGGQYRTDEYVDIETCSEGGYNIGYMDIGEWLNYSVEVKETGVYELGVRVASPNSGKVLHIEMNGVDISGPVTVPNTGDWQKYKTVKISNVQLTAGVQTMKIVMDEAEFNLNYVEFKKSSSPTVSSPYKGTPALIPGKIEAENFDLGGLNIAYYDDTKDNKGGQYRTDEYVDIETCSEGGYDIGFMDIGEWLNYSVEVKETGTYDLGVRVASPNSGKVLHVEMNGVDISGSVTIPNTGDWQKYTTLKISNVQLAAGLQTMKIVMDSAEFNLNYVEFKKTSSSPTVSSPYKGSPALIPGKIEAENFDLGGLNIAYYDDTKDNKGGQYRTDEYVDIESCSEGGYDIGYMDIGEWLNYSVEVKETGTYELGVRVASPNSGKTLHVEMNGVNISGPVTVPNTGDWQKYTTVKISNVQLTAGLQTMKIVLDSAEFNLNYVEFNPASTPSLPSGACQLTEVPDASKFVVRNQFTDQYLGAGASNENNALKVTQRQWGQSYLYVIESGAKHSVEAGKSYTISFDFKDDADVNIASIETGFAKSIEWYGAENVQPLAKIEGDFTSSDFVNKSVSFNALSTGSYYLVLKLNWNGQPNKQLVNYVKNISICEEIAMPSAARAALGMTIAGPNPFNDETLVSIPFAGNGVSEATVSINDVYGKPVTVYTTTFEGQLLPIGKGLAIGTYIVTVTYEENSYTTRIIKN